MLLSLDQFRPTLHFTAPYGWLNDPNGLVYVRGEWHMFYQCYPHDIVWNDMHWGHAVSTNLVNWKHLPTALTPDDKGVCFSGSAVVDHNNSSGLFSEGDANIVALYTSTVGLSVNQHDGLQAQSIAYSKDGLKFTKLTEKNPIIANWGCKHFRDPKVVWHGESQQWVMVLTEGQEIAFYGSKNLINWEKMSTWGRGEACHDSSSWECPDLFSIVDDYSVRRWVLVIGVIHNGYAGGSGTQYVLGDFNGRKFTNMNDKETVLWMDYGRDFYATQSYSDAPNNRRVAIAWMSNWLYANDVPATSHRSAMTFPRELKLITTKQGLRISQAFASEALYEIDNGVGLAGQIIEENELHVLTARTVGSLIEMQLTLAKGGMLTLKPFDNDALIYQISRKKSTYQVRVIRNIDVQGNARYQKNFAQDNCFDLVGTERLKLSLLRDITSCEIIFNDGTQSCTDLTFVSSMGPLTLTVTSGDCEINTFKELGNKG